MIQMAGTRANRYCFFFSYKITDPKPGSPFHWHFLPTPLLVNAHSAPADIFPSFIPPTTSSFFTSGPPHPINSFPSCSPTSPIFTSLFSGPQNSSFVPSLAPVEGTRGMIVPHKLAAAPLTPDGFQFAYSFEDFIAGVPTWTLSPGNLGGILSPAVLTPSLRSPYVSTDGSYF